MRATRPFVVFLVATGVFLLCSSQAAGAPSRTGKMAPPSGLRPVFSDNARCTRIASPYGSPTRYDGSQRPSFRFGGRHGGIDLTLPVGTPLLALAGGTVVTKGEGEMMEGIYLWLQHPPEETGLSYWVYSKYQHLQSLPKLPVGAKVVAGQVIAYSGKTGTEGGHYGSEGYPHLHLSTLKSATETYRIKGSLVLTPGATLIDPLSVYRETIPPSVKPLDGTTVIIPCVSADGRIVPEGARVVWPVACQAR